MSAYMKLCMKYVLDGGSLIIGQTCEGAMTCYVKYVKGFTNQLLSLMDTSQGHQQKAQLIRDGQ